MKYCKNSIYWLSNVSIINHFFHIYFIVGTFSVKLPKLNLGEFFEGLDLLITLLAPKKKSPVTVKPLMSELTGKLIYFMF